MNDSIWTRSGSGPSLRALLTPTLLSFLLVAGSWAGSGPDLTGRWIRNAQESDDLHEKLEESMASRRGGGEGGGGRGGGRGGSGRGGSRGQGGFAGGGGGRGGGGSQGQPSSRSRMSLLRGLGGQYDEISIEQSGEEITFHFTDETSRTLVPGAREIDDGYDDDTARSTHCSWDGDVLTVETETSVGERTMTMTETWSLSEDGEKLILELESSGGPLAGTELVQVYDRDIT